ncbi:hypothetical protein J6G99_02540 [bacterium]|nr:hypothetical protein [bacterium]
MYSQTFNNKINNITAFKSRYKNQTNYDKDRYNEAKQYGKINGMFHGLYLGLALPLVAFIIPDAHKLTNKLADSQNFDKEINNIMKDKTIDKDTLIVKDINDDDCPEIILFKKDGSKVAIDAIGKDIIQIKK